MLAESALIHVEPIHRTPSVPPVSLEPKYLQSTMLMRGTSQVSFLPLISIAVSI